MKKIILASMVLAAVSVYADVKTLGAAGQPTDRLGKGVYAITLTQKGLDIVTATKSYTQPTKDFDALADDPIDAVAAGEEYFEETIKESYGDYIDLVELQSVTTKTVKKTIKKKTYKHYAYVIKYTAPTMTSEKKPATKVVTSTLNGLYVTGYDDGEAEVENGVYLWNKQIGETYYNEYVSKKNLVKLANGYREDFEIVSDDQSVTSDGKSDAGFNWGSMQGWGTGTANKGVDGVYDTIKTVAGSTVDQDCRRSGTWKFQPDSKATKLANEGATIEQILATKKVELCK